MGSTDPERTGDGWQPEHIPAGQVPAWSPQPPLPAEPAYDATIVVRVRAPSLAAARVALGSHMPCRVLSIEPVS